MHGYLVTISDTGTIIRTKVNCPGMVDQQGYYDVYPSHIEVIRPRDWDHRDFRGVKHLSDNRICLLSPFVHCYCFETRQWGIVRVDQIRPHVYDNQAFEQINLEEPRKSVIRALVEAPGRYSESGTKAVGDLIADKTQGCWILLHGPPGTGKTLIAEACANLVQRPLLSVSCGDLAREVIRMELSFLDLLKMARTWEAILVMDDCEALFATGDRTLNSCFLGYLDYFPGICFFTTTLAKTLDVGIFSRCSLTVHLPEPDDDSRNALWSQVLERAGVAIGIKSVDDKIAVTKRDVERFASEKIPGRVILRVVQGAQAVAMAEGKPLGASQIDRVLRLRKEAAYDLSNVDQSGQHIDDNDGRAMWM